MKFSEFENALSAPRLGRYLRACSGNTKKALTLYRYNIKLGQSFLWRYRSLGGRAQDGNQ